MSAKPLKLTTADELLPGDRIVITEAKRKYYTVTGTFQSVHDVAALGEGYTIKRVTLTGVQRTHNEYTYRNRASLMDFLVLSVDIDTDKTIRRYPTEQHP